MHPLLGDDGWTFDTGFPGATGDRLGGRRFLREVYLDHDPGITSRVTVPVLWDKETGTIVSNELAEIIRMLNSAFDRITGNTLDLSPLALRDEIDAVNARVYDGFNNGVYRAGFARSQAAYERAAAEVFATLDWMEARLASAALAGRRPADRGRLAGGDDAVPLRPRLPRALQVQPAADRRLSEPLGLRARALPVARRRRHRALRPYRVPLLREPPLDQSDRHRPDRTGDRLEGAARPRRGVGGLRLSRPRAPPRAGRRRGGRRSARSAPPCRRAAAACAGGRGRSG